MLMCFWVTIVSAANRRLSHPPPITCSRDIDQEDDVSSSAGEASSPKNLFSCFLHFPIYLKGSFFGSIAMVCDSVSV